MFLVKLAVLTQLHLPLSISSVLLSSIVLLLALTALQGNLFNWSLFFTSHDPLLTLEKALDRIRTGDPHLTMVVLCRLSYKGKPQIIHDIRVEQKISKQHFFVNRCLYLSIKTSFVSFSGLAHLTDICDDIQDY